MKWCTDKHVLYKKRAKHVCFNVHECVTLLQRFALWYQICPGTLFAAIDLSSSMCPLLLVLKKQHREWVLGFLQHCSTSVAQSASGGWAFMPQGYTETHWSQRTRATDHVRQLAEEYRMYIGWRVYFFHLGIIINVNKCSLHSQDIAQKECEYSTSKEAIENGIVTWATQGVVAF